MVRIKKPTKEQMEEKWKSTNPRDLAYEIATFMGGEWPTRPVRKVQLSLDDAPQDPEDLMEMTNLNPTLLSEMSVMTRLLFLEVYYDDVQDVYSQVMESMAGDGRVTFDSLRKMKHLVISLGFRAINDVCQEGFDSPKTDDWDEFPEVAPDQRPGMYCALDIAKFTQHAAAVTALVKLFVDSEGELPPEAEARIIHVEKKFYYEARRPPPPPPLLTARPRCPRRLPSPRPHRTSKLRRGDFFAASMRRSRATEDFVPVFPCRLPGRTARWASLFALRRLGPTRCPAISYNVTRDLFCIRRRAILYVTTRRGDTIMHVFTFHIHARDMG